MTAPVPPHPPLQDFYGDARNRESYVRSIFDESAPWYDWTVRFMSFGSGHRYRRMALERSGLKPGMRLLDLASGTGVVARAALEILGDGKHIVAADPSIGMLSAGNPPVPKSGAAAERLPFEDASFDFISIGFALRHFADLRMVFDECRRVLRPNGRILILEITSPRSRVGRAVLGAFMGTVIPAGVLLRSRSRRAAQLMRYYWATTRDCVRPEVILQTLADAGFRDAKRHVELGVFSEYSAATQAD